jgi:2-dehydro-3-deoxyphosphogluconate aldolase/(4S)-4-hydroxy-2-oxoglutarate aldolase
MTIFPEVLLQRLRKSGVIAGFSVDNAEQAVPLCRALLAGGIDVIELMLRSAAGMDGVRAVCANLPEMLVGVGTILTPEQAREVKAAGAAFGVAPGTNPHVIRAAQEVGLAFAPGICTPSDLEAAIELGCRFVKFFPAEAAGGVHYLRSIAAPYEHLGIRYFPLGGLNAENMISYLKEDNVLAIGGSWIVKRDLVLNENWNEITARAAAVRRIVDKARK